MSIRPGKGDWMDLLIALAYLIKKLIERIKAEKR